VVNSIVTTIMYGVYLEKSQSYLKIIIVTTNYFFKTSTIVSAVL